MPGFPFSAPILGFVFALGPECHSELRSTALRETLVLSVPCATPVYLSVANPFKRLQTPNTIRDAAYRITKKKSSKPSKSSKYRKRKSK